MVLKELGAPRKLTMRHELIAVANGRKGYKSCGGWTHGRGLEAQVGQREERPLASHHDHWPLILRGILCLEHKAALLGGPQTDRILAAVIRP